MDFWPPLLLNPPLLLPLFISFRKNFWSSPQLLRPTPSPPLYLAPESRCVIGTCYCDMRYSELHKKHSNVDRDIIMHKLPLVGAVRAAWINVILRSGKQVIRNGILAWLID